LDLRWLVNVSFSKASSCTYALYRPHSTTSICKQYGINKAVSTKRYQQSGINKAVSTKRYQQSGINKAVSTKRYQQSGIKAV